MERYGDGGAGGAPRRLCALFRAALGAGVGSLLGEEGFRVDASEEHRLQGAWAPDMARHTVSQQALRVGFTLSAQLEMSRRLRRRLKADPTLRGQLGSSLAAAACDAHAAAALEKNALEKTAQGRNPQGQVSRPLAEQPQALQLPQLGGQGQRDGVALAGIPMKVPRHVTAGEGRLADAPRDQERATCSGPNTGLLFETPGIEPILMGDLDGAFDLR
mmetsp:Transcript_67738/g.153295  ORF Transcript_67738/g.153295 Transcript_67738/m.153295 type:complete len:217 (+) Transcript_67738:647-1297(+)